MLFDFCVSFCKLLESVLRLVWLFVKRALVIVGIPVVIAMVVACVIPFSAISFVAWLCMLIYFAKLAIKAVYK